MARTAPRIHLVMAEQQHLQRLVAAHSTPQALVFRARIILRCAQPDQPRNDHVAQQMGCQADTVSKWRRRFQQLRLEGLRDLPRSGRPRAFSPEDRHKVLVLATTKPDQADVPVSHWSLADLATHLINDAHYQTMSRSTIQRLLSEAELKPHKVQSWLHSNDPDFEKSTLKICGLYVDAPCLYEQGELVVCTDEKTSIQALERKYPGKPMCRGHAEKREFEYIRHGTRCLLASFVVATGHVYGDVTARRTNQDFRRHLRHTVSWLHEQYSPVKKVHWVMDNLNTHWSLPVCRLFAKLNGVKFVAHKLTRGSQRRAFLTQTEHKQVIHFTPKHGSWLNQVEMWFGVLVRRVVRRGNFVSKADLTRKILAYIEYHNTYKAHPYAWTYTGKPLVADQVQPKKKRRKKDLFTLNL